MAVTLDDLGTGGVWLEAEPGTDRFLQLGRYIGMRAHGARDLANGHLAPRRPEPFSVAPDLGNPDCKSVAKGGWLGMDAMAAADLRGVLVANGQLRLGCFKARQVSIQDVDRLNSLKRQGGVDHVRRGQPEVDETSGLADTLRHGSDEGRHVVVNLLEQRLHPGVIEAGAANLGHRIRWDDV
jgi:hypothetical protein